MVIQPACKLHMIVMANIAESNSTSPLIQGDLVLKSSNLTRLFSTAAVLGALAAPAVADEHEGITLPGASAEVTLDYVTNYFFRGYEQQLDEGIIIQPGASFTIPVVDGVDATIGTWGSFHTEQPVGSDSNLYEQDIYAGLDTTVGDFSLSVLYNVYTYPDNTLTSVNELGFGIGFDDSEYLGDFAFSPYAYVGIEVNGTNSNNATEAVYLELGGAFSLDGLTEGTFAEAWSWEVPITVGLSLDDYYNDASGAEETLGFVSVALAGSIPMSELIGSDEWFGAWDLSVGLSLLFIGSDLDGVITDNGNEFQIIGSAGLARSW